MIETTRPIVSVCPRGFIASLASVVSGKSGAKVGYVVTTEGRADNARKNLQRSLDERWRAWTEVRRGSRSCFVDQRDGSIEILSRGTPLPHIQATHFTHLYYEVDLEESFMRTLNSRVRPRERGAEPSAPPLDASDAPTPIARYPDWRFIVEALPSRTAVEVAVSAEGLRFGPDMLVPWDRIDELRARSERNG